MVLADSVREMNVETRVTCPLHWQCSPSEDRSHQEARPKSTEVRYYALYGVAG